MTENSTVFVVDDDPGALESLRWMLEQADFRVKAFGSSREFLDSYHPEEKGCLVLDVRMPEIDGLALQQTLRDRKIRLPIIFMTAYGDVPTCACAFRGGAVDFLEKPVNDKVLLGTSNDSWPGKSISTTTAETIVSVIAWACSRRPKPRC